MAENVPPPGFGTVLLAQPPPGQPAIFVKSQKGTEFFKMRTIFAIGCSGASLAPRSSPTDVLNRRRVVNPPLYPIKLSDKPTFMEVCENFVK